MFVFHVFQFRFNVNGPSFAPLFQFPPRMKADVRFARLRALASLISDARKNGMLRAYARILSAGYRR